MSPTLLLASASLYCYFGHSSSGTSSPRRLSRMRKSLILVLVPAFALSGCALFGRGGSAAPDEFAVARNAPLVIPPDYTLTPPAAGAIASTPQDAQARAIEALFGGPAPRSQS